MLYEISPLEGIVWGKKGNERILQNIINLLNTRIYEIAYKRTCGLTRSYMDKTIEQINSEIVSDVVELIHTHEPRATVKDVKVLDISDEGNLNIKVVVDI